MWDNFEALAETFECDDVILIRGRVKLYNGQKEVTLEQIVPSAERDYDLAIFWRTRNTTWKNFTPSCAPRSRR